MWFSELLIHGYNLGFTIEIIFSKNKGLFLFWIYETSLSHSYEADYNLIYISIYMEIPQNIRICFKKWISKENIIFMYFFYLFTQSTCLRPSYKMVYISVFKIIGKSHYQEQKRTQRLHCAILWQNVTLFSQYFWISKNVYKKV